VVLLASVRVQRAVVGGVVEAVAIAVGERVADVADVVAVAIPPP
jgi:hypothetical protein